MAGTNTYPPCACYGAVLNRTKTSKEGPYLCPCVTVFRWGSGKSFLVQLLKREFDKDVQSDETTKQLQQKFEREDEDEPVQTKNDILRASRSKIINNIMDFLDMLTYVLGVIIDYLDMIMFVVGVVYRDDDEFSLYAVRRKLKTLYFFLWLVCECTVCT